MFLESRSLVASENVNPARRAAASPSRPRTEVPPREVFEAVWQRRWVAVWTFVICVGAAAAYLKLTTPVYTAMAKLYVTPDVPGSAGMGGPERAKNYLNTQAELLKSTPIVGRVAELPAIRAMATFAEAVDVARSLKERLIVELGNKDGLIELRLDSNSPHEAAQVVNAVVESYVAYQNTKKRSSATEMLTILRKERGAWARELAEKRQAVVRFKQENAVLPFRNARGGNGTGNDGGGNPILQRLTQLSDARTAAQLHVMEAAAAYQTMRSALIDPARRQEVAAAIVTDAAATATERGRAALQNELHSAQLRLALLESRRLGPRNPAVVGLVVHIAGVKTQLAELDLELVTARVASHEQAWREAEQRLAAIDKAFEEPRNEALALNATEARLAELESGVHQAQTLVEGIDARIKELGIDGETGGLNVEVLEWAAANPEPSKPRKPLVLVAATLLGLILGLLLALIRASTDRRLRTSEQIEQTLGIPVLSAIPRIGRRARLAARLPGAAVAPSQGADAYRTIRTAIHFNSHGRPIKTLVITSAVKGEGKSTVARNLAAAMAEAGERTLLVDADLRWPSLHMAFKVRNVTGLSTKLAGVNGEAVAICATTVNGLDVLPSGPIPSNPSALLSGAGFEELLEQLSQYYDRIVLDAPPVLGMPDALILGARCDATLLVVRADVSDRGATEAAFAALVNIGTRSIATVMNGVRRRHSYSRYARGYYYDYQHPLLHAAQAQPNNRVASAQVSAAIAADRSPEGRAVVPDEVPRPTRPVIGRVVPVSKKAGAPANGR